MSDFLRRASNTGVVGVAVFAMLLMTGTERAAWAQSVFGPTSSFGPFIPQAQLPATGPTAISGDTALVAADGVVHVFERDPETDAWTEVTPLTPSDGGASFGRAVAIDGVRAIVGAEDAAYVFRRRSGGVWREVAKFVPSDGVQGFGVSVDIDGRHAIVGSPASAFGDVGAAYIFRENRGAPGWTEEASLDPPSPSRASFGARVGISGDAAIVGDLGEGTPEPNGAAFIFDRDQGGLEQWGLVRNLGLFHFMQGVAIDGDTAIVSFGEPVACIALAVFGRDIGGQNAWGPDPRPGFTCGGGVSPSISGDNAIFISPSFPSLGSFIVARNQGQLLTPQSAGGPNAWGIVSSLRILRSGPPLPPFRLTGSSISGDTAVIAVSSTSAPFTGHVEVLVSDVDGDGIRDGRDPCVRDPLNYVAGGCQRASAQYPVLDDLISQDDVTTETRNNRFIITATFTNTSQSAVKNPFFEVTELTGRNVLINSDAGRGGVGATISPDVGDGVLSPGESMAVEFVIRLRRRDAFEFRVTFRGEPAS